MKHFDYRRCTIFPTVFALWFIGVFAAGCDDDCCTCRCEGTYCESEIGLSGKPMDCEEACREACAEDHCPFVSGAICVDRGESDELCCESRSCGEDCGISCGECATGEVCSAAGACVPDPGSVDPPPDPDDTIEQLQRGEFGAGDEVVLEDVVVTSPSSEAGFYIQEPGGGPWSGCLVVSTPQLFEELSLSVGSVVNVDGVVGEFFDFTQITEATVRTVGESFDVTVDELDGAGPDDWERWEGCLISLPNQTVVSTGPYGEATLSAGILLDDVFFSWTLEEGSQCASIVGLVGFSFDTYRLTPRNADDLINCTSL